MSRTATSTSVDQTQMEADKKVDDDTAVIGNSKKKEIPKQVLEPKPSTSASLINKKDEPSVPVQSTQSTPICLDQDELQGSTSHQASQERIGQLSSSFSGRSMETSDSDKSVWINGITESTTIAQLQDLCRPYGTPMVIRLYKQKKKSDTNARVVMVKMATAEDADTLVNKLPLHFDKKLNVTVSKKTRRRRKRENRPSSEGIHSETLEEDETRIKKQKCESDYYWPLNQSGESREPLKKSNSWSLLKNNIKDIQCMGFSVLEELDCLDREEQQVQRNKNSDVKEDFHIGIDPIQDTDNSLTGIKEKNQAYPKSMEEFTQIMRNYLANLMGNEVRGPLQGSLDHSQLSKEVQNARNLTEVGPEVIHERIKENYTHIKEWILTTCVPLSMAFKMGSQTDVNKELISGALKCLLGIVHQIPQLKVRDLELANEYEKNKVLTTEKEVTTSDASVQVVPETVSEVVQTLKIFSQSKFVQTELESKSQEKCEKIKDSEKSLAESRQLGVTSFAKATLTSNSCKPACSKGVQTESTCLQKYEFDITNDSSKMERQQCVPSNVDSCLSGNLAKSTPSTSHRSHDSPAQQNSYVTEITMQHKNVMTKPVHCGVKGKKMTNTVPQSKETGSSLGVKRSKEQMTVKLEERKEEPISVKGKASKEVSTSTTNEAKMLSVESKCIEGKAVKEKETTKVTKEKMGSLVEGKCVEMKLSKGEETSSIAEETRGPVVEGKCVKEETNKGQKVVSNTGEPKNPSDKCTSGMSEEKEMASIVEEKKVSSVDEMKGMAHMINVIKTALEGKCGLEETSKSVTGEGKRPLIKDKSVKEKASVSRETKRPPVKGKSVKGKANVPREARTQFHKLGQCRNPEGNERTEQMSLSEETETLVVNDKHDKRNANEGENMTNVVEERETLSVECRHFRGKVNKELEIANIAEETKSKSAKGKHVNEKACRTQEIESMVETIRPLVESKCIKGKMASTTEKKMEGIIVTDNKLRSEAACNYAKVINPTEITAKDGVTDSIGKNKDHRKCEATEEGSYSEIEDSGKIINVVNVKSGNIEKIESKDVTLLNSKPADPKIKIESTDSVMMLGREKRDSKSSVHSKISEEGELLEDLDRSQCGETKVKVKFITSSKMIIDLDEESKVNSAKLPLSKETTTVNLSEMSKKLRSFKSEVDLSDCPPVSENVERVSHDTEKKVVKIVTGNISQNRDEKRKVVESECIDKKRFKVNEKGVFVVRTTSSVMEDSRKQESCPSTGSQTSIGSAVNLKILEKVRESQYTQANMACQSYMDVCIQSSKSEKNNTVKDNIATGTTDMSRDSKQSRRRDSKDREEHINTGAKNLNKGKEQAGGPSRKNCNSKRNNTDNENENQKSDQSREPDKSEVSKEGMYLRTEVSRKDKIEDKIKCKSEKENAKLEEQKICEESKDRGEQRRCTEKGSEQVQESCKEMLNKNIKSMILRTKNIDGKGEKACRSKLIEKQESKDRDGQNLTSKCEQRNERGKRKCQTQTKEGKQIDVKVESEEASEVSSRGSSGKSKEDSITASGKKQERKSTSEGSSRHKDESRVARKRRQAVNKKAVASSLTLPSSSQESWRQTKFSNRKLSDGPQTRLSRRKNPDYPEGKKLRSRIPCTPSKLHRGYKTPDTRNKTESRYLDESTFQVWGNTKSRHKTLSVNTCVERKNLVFLEISNPQDAYNLCREKEKKNLCLDGYLYIKDKRVNNKIYWKCEMYRKRKCSARAITVDDSIQKQSGNHNHAGDAAEIDVATAMKKV